MKITAYIVTDPRNKRNLVLEPLYKKKHRKNCDGKCACNALIYGRFFVYPTPKSAKSFDTRFGLKIKKCEITL